MRRPLVLSWTEAVKFLFRESFLTIRKKVNKTKQDFFFNEQIGTFISGILEMLLHFTLLLATSLSMAFTLVEWYNKLTFYGMKLTLNSFLVLPTN